MFVGMFMEAGVVWDKIWANTKVKKNAFYKQCQNFQNLRNKELKA